MKIEKTLLHHVENEVDNLDFGKVTIEVRNGRAVDVVTERRVRFEEKKESLKIKSTEQRRG